LHSTLKDILLGYDGSDAARRALDVAADLATAEDGSVTVVSVVPVYGGLTGVDPLDNRALHQLELREARDLLQARGVRTVGFLASGDPARELSRIAREGDYDAIVVGAPIHHRLARAIWGCTSEHVAAHADRRVLLVP